MCVYTQEEKKNAKYIKCALGSPCEKLSGSCRTKKKYESHSSTGDLCLPTHTQPCTHSTAGLGNTVKYNCCVKPMHNKTCYMAKKTI